MGIQVTRSTSESIITVTIDVGKVAPDYRVKINTPYPFLNHMIEHVVWRSGINIAMDIQLAHFTLSHLVCEDAGQALGKAIAEYIKTTPAVYGFGDGMGMIDEARAFCAVSFESRTMFVFDKRVELPNETEGMLSEDLMTFIDGVVNGANCTMHIEFCRGENGHHVWEAIFRAIGLALGKAVSVNALREGQTSGVAGTVNFDIKHL